MEQRKKILRPRIEDAGLSSDLRERFLRILSEWKGTPYYNGMMTKKVGVDCWRFCYGVFYEWIGIPFGNPETEFTTIYNLSSKAKFTAAQVVRGMFPFHRKRVSDVLFPGDIIFWKHHLAIVGPDNIWDCKVGKGVGTTGIHNDFKLYRYANGES